VSGFEPLTVRLQGASGLSLGIAGRGSICRLAAVIVGLSRLTSLNDWQRWLPEWLPKLTAWLLAWLGKCSPAATIDSGRAEEVRQPRASSGNQVTPTSTSRPETLQLTRRSLIASPMAFVVRGSVEYRQVVSTCRLKTGLPE
jgi:hypothetical protein